MNRWAVVSMWRRSFELQEEREQEEQEMLEDLWDEIVDEEEKCPIRNPEVVNARNESLNDHYRKIKTTTLPTAVVRDSSPPPPRDPQQVMRQHQLIHNPDLAVPVGGTTVHLAQ